MQQPMFQHDMFTRKSQKKPFVQTKIVALVHQHSFTKMRKCVELVLAAESGENEMQRPKSKRISEFQPPHINWF